MSNIQDICDIKEGIILINLLQLLSVWISIVFGRMWNASSIDFIEIIFWKKEKNKKNFWGKISNFWHFIKSMQIVVPGKVGAAW